MADQHSNLSLPALTGSDKQAEWANRIRSGTLQEVRERLCAYPDDLADQAMHIYADIAGRRTEASWWIDRRDYRRDSINPRELVTLVTEDDRAALADLADQAKLRAGRA